MADRRFKEAINSLIEVTRRNLIEDAVIKVPVLGGVGVSFGNVPNVPVEGLLFAGIVTLPTSDDALSGWGMPFPPLPLGTPGGANPEVIFVKDSLTSAISVSRSDTWFDNFGSVSMDQLIGGSDWQSTDSSIVISYGDIDKNRYHESPGPGVFKDGVDLTAIFAAHTVNLIAVAAIPSEPALLFATTAPSGGLGTVLTVTAVFTTDTTFNTIDVGTSPQIVLTYDTNLLNDAVDPSIVSSANFSPGADKLVVTVGNGGMVEFSITSLVGTPVLEKNIVTSTDRTYQPGEITVSPITFETINEFVTCGVSSTGGGWRYTFDQRRRDRFVINTTMTKSDVTFIVDSDFDQVTNNRVDLELKVSGTRTHVESQAGAYFEQITSGIIVDTPLGTDPNGDLCGVNPQAIFNVGSIVNGGTITFRTDTNQKCTDTGTVTTLSIDGNIIATLQPLKDVEHTVLTTPPGPDIQFANSTIYEFDRVFDADLRTGFIAFTHVELDRTSVIYTGSGTVDMTENREYVIEGGSYLVDDTNTETIISTPLIGSGGGPYDILDFEDRCSDFDETDPIYTTVFTSGIPSLSRFSSKTLSGASAFKSPDHQMAYIDMQHGRGGSYQYQAYSDGDPVVISEITGTNPQVLPRGII